MGKRRDSGDETVESNKMTEHSLARHDKTGGVATNWCCGRRNDESNACFRGRVQEDDLEEEGYHEEKLFHRQQETP